MALDLQVFTPFASQCPGCGSVIPRDHSDTCPTRMVLAKPPPKGWVWCPEHGSLQPPEGCPRCWNTAVDP